MKKSTLLLLLSFVAKVISLRISLSKFALPVQRESRRVSIDDGKYLCHGSHIRSEDTRLHAASAGVTGGLSSARTSVPTINKLFKRTTWFSGWCQVILSVVSAVILTFANTVRQNGAGWPSMWSNGFSFTSLGVIVAFMNTFWTWNITRFCRRVSAGRVEEQKIFPTFRRFSRVSVYMSIFGMILTLFGAEQIVGTLASKVLSSQGNFFPIIATTGAASGLVQALDIFLIQANTNSVIANFIPLVCYLWLQTQLPTRPPGNRQGPKFAQSSSSTSGGTDTQTSNARNNVAQTTDNNSNSGNRNFAATDSGNVIDTDIAEELQPAGQQRAGSGQGSQSQSGGSSGANSSNKGRISWFEETEDDDF